MGQVLHGCARTTHAVRAELDCGHFTWEDAAREYGELTSAWIKMDMLGLKFSPATKDWTSSGQIIRLPSAEKRGVP